MEKCVNKTKIGHYEKDLYVCYKHCPKYSSFLI